MQGVSVVCCGAKREWKQCGNTYDLYDQTFLVCVCARVPQKGSSILLYRKLLLWIHRIRDAKMKKKKIKKKKKREEDIETVK